MQSSFAQPTRTNSAAIAVVVLMHAAGITALALAKTEAFRDPPKIIDLIDIPSPKPKDPPPPEPVKQSMQKPQHDTRMFIPDPIIPIINDGPPVDTTPTPQIEPLPFTPPGPIEVARLPDPPPPPEPKKIEPARARANLASYVSDSDYPAAAIRSEEQGTARFRLTVGADGRVTGCTITGSSGSSALDSATCRIMKQRARFTPARDGAGNPATDTVSNAIKWVLPE